MTNIFKLIKQNLFTCFVILFFILLVGLIVFIGYQYIYQPYSIAFSGAVAPTINEARDIRAAWGQLGDYFGGTLNPIFGFASFIALLVTILYQAKELNASTKELKNSAKALAAQNKAIERQSFEQTFFSWLNTYHLLIDSITVFQNTDKRPSIAAEPLKLNGRQALGSIWQQHFTYGFVDINFANNGQLSSESVFLCWEMLIDTSGSQVEPLFNNLQQMILWVERQESSKLSLVDKHFFIDIISTQLSNVELRFLFIYGLTEKGAKLKQLFEKFSFFKHMNFDDMYLKALKEDNKSKMKYDLEAFSQSSPQLA